MVAKNNLVDNNTKKILQAGLNIDPSSYVDPNGFLFHENDQLLRIIYPHVAAFYQQLFDNGTIQQLTNQFNLVQSSPIKLNKPELNKELIIQHEKISPVTYCTEWCPSMLKNAARQTLSLSLELIKKGLMLQDAYPWNIVFQGTKPIFVDFTSIVPINAAYLWPAYSQYQAFFHRPLALTTMKKDKIARLLLLDNINGITLEDFYNQTSFLYRLHNPSLVCSYYLNRLIQKHTRLKVQLHKVATRGSTVDPKIRARFFNRLLKQIDRLAIKSPNDAWQHYYRDIPAGVDKNKKLKIIDQILQRIAPKSVTDLGCNTGVFSIIAAQKGARVIAIDSNTSCIESLYETAKDKKLDLYPIVSDVICSTPPNGIMGRQYPGLIQRAKSEMVLCLGLMHHLHINGRQPFEKIAQLLAVYCQKHAIIEYVDTKDVNIKLLTVEQTYDYNLKIVMDALYTQFSTIEQFESDRSSRKILLCSRS